MSTLNTADLMWLAGIKKIGKLVLTAFDELWSCIWGSFRIWSLCTVLTSTTYQNTAKCIFISFIHVSLAGQMHSLKPSLLRMPWKLVLIHFSVHLRRWNIVTVRRRVLRLPALITCLSMWRVWWVPTLEKSSKFSSIYMTDGRTGHWGSHLSKNM